MTSEMELGDGSRRQRPQVGERVEGVIARAHVDVVDVAQDAAAGARRDGGDELPLRDGGMAVTQVRRWVLQQESAAEELLRPLHVAADDAERLLGKRQRQQI